MEDNKNTKIDLDGINAIPMSHRTMSGMDYAMVFWSSTIIVQIMVIGLYILHPIGQLNFLQVIMVGLISSIILSFLRQKAAYYELNMESHLLFKQEQDLEIMVQG